MIATQPRHAPLSSIVAAALLIIFSASGLMAGGITFKLTGGFALAGRAPSSTPQSHQPVTSRTPTPTATPATAAITRPFTLTLAISPSVSHPGDPIQATLTASDAATQAPLAGLRCTLETPEAGGTPLLSTWPAPATTDALGQATWAFTLPAMAPGIYAIGFTATGATGYRYHGQISISVTTAG